MTNIRMCESVSLRLDMTRLAKLIAESSDFKREKEMMVYGVQTHKLPRYQPGYLLMLVLQDTSVHAAEALAETKQQNYPNGKCMQQGP